MTLSHWEYSLPYRSVLVSWCSSYYLLILVPALFMFCTGSCLLCQCIQGCSPLSHWSGSNVSGSMLRCLIHLYLSVVQGNKYGSICILLHGNIQLEQHHLLKMLSFFLFFIVFIWLLYKNPGCLQVYEITCRFSIQFHWPTCQFYANTMWFLLLRLLVQLEIKKGDTSGSSFTLHNYFRSPGLPEAI